DRMSIGYRTIQEDYDKDQDARILKEVQLLEYSMITKNFAANDAALLTSVKRTYFRDDEIEQLKQEIEWLKKMIMADPQTSTQPKINIFDDEVKKLVEEMKNYVGGL